MLFRSILSDIKKQFDIDQDIDLEIIFRLSNEKIAKELTDNSKIKEIAIKTYTPYPENKNWSKEYKRIYQENVKNRVEKGYGTIPNKIIREEISKIIKDFIEEQNIIKAQSEKTFNNLLLKAKATGEEQVIKKWSEPCNDPNEECSLDICSEYIMPNGIIEHRRHHTW